MKHSKKAEKNQQTQDKVRFSIGTKLITIISIFVIFSLGSITALVSWMVREDLKIAAEDNNFEANRRAAQEAEDALENMRAVSSQLMYTINILEAQSGLIQKAAALPAAQSAIQSAADFFFTQNPRAAAFTYTFKGTRNVLVNRNYFLSRDIDPSRAEIYFNDNETSLLRAAGGETVLLNAAPVFTRPVLALFFPWQGSGGGVLIASEKLVDSFGSGTNQSFLINDKCDILIHSDFALLLDGVNAADFDFIRKIQEAPDRSKQELIYADFNFRSAASTASTGSAAVQYYTAFTKLAYGGCIVITGIEHDKVFEGITATTRRNIYLTIAVLFISVMFIWFFSKTISTPLKTLAQAAKSIEGGQFEQQLRLKGRDEIGLLGASFQKMSGALRIFGRFTNREIAVKAMRGEIKPGGLHKHATIFFSDIRGFTALSENFTKAFGNEASDKIVFWLNNYLTSMVECVEKTGGAVDKFIGDAVMAHWGTAYTAGSPRKDAFNCIKAALMMRHALMALNKNRTANDPGNPPIRIGCGINTGIVTAGQIGSDLRMEYTVIGDPVNLASRVEALTKPLA
ncbi:MAG: adenylate/guanylate cyclase domain-containing protein, partial [Treponema sp.]|nr:adenylate/guanylate cyclase domain-containing protein [Treponema sp.]